MNICVGGFFFYLHCMTEYFTNFIKFMVDQVHELRWCSHFALGPQRKIVYQSRSGSAEEAGKEYYTRWEDCVRWARRRDWAADAAVSVAGPAMLPGSETEPGQY